MPTVSSDSPPLRVFATALGARDPKTVATYLTTVRDFVAWLATQPAGTPFHLGLVTETAVRGYMDSLSAANRAPRTRSKALSALRRFCQWAVDEGLLRRNPARSIERPTVVAVAPTELSDKDCVARNLRGMLEACNLTFLFSLDSHSKQAGDECNLLHAVSFFCAMDLSFPEHIYGFISLYSSPRRLE